MFLRNIPILTFCQLISATGAFSMVTLGAIIGARLATNPALATLPVSIMVVCVAATTIPATMLMRRIGRRRGFALASLSSVVSLSIAGLALHQQSFLLFGVAAAVFGINMAFTQQYRYAAVESVEPPYVPRAVSFVLVGALGGAFAGEQIVRLGEFAIPSTQYLGTLVALAALYVLQSLLFLTLAPLHADSQADTGPPARPLAEIAAQPVFIVAVMGGTVAYGVMTFIMTATPLSMHVHDGFTLEETLPVIRNHVLGMYAPSLVSGFLIERFGLVRIMSAGAFGLIAACLIGMHGQSYMHYWYALILLGVGWNFLYVGGTTMLTLGYRMSERFRAQAVNEFCVFGTSATGSLLAGTIIYLYGWYTLVVAPLPLLALILGGLWYVRRDAQLGKPQAASGVAG